MNRDEPLPVRFPTIYLGRPVSTRWPRDVSRPIFRREEATDAILDDFPHGATALGDVFEEIEGRFGRDTEFSLVTNLMQGHPQGTGPADPIWAPEFYGREDMWSSQDCLPAGVPQGPKYDHPSYAPGQVYLVCPGMWSRSHPPYDPMQDGSLLYRDRREMYGRLHPGAENTYKGPFKM